MGNASDENNKDEPSSPKWPQFIASQSEKHFTESLLATFIISGIAACNTEIYTYPLDLYKTRLQLQGELGADKGKYRGLVATAVGIIREEGFFSQWRGITPALYRHIIYSGSRLLFYEKFRQQFGEDRKLKVWQAALFGATAGGLAQWIANPTDLVKTQAQMDGKRILMGLEPRFKSFWQSFMHIYKRGGIKGLYSGSAPSVIRAAFVNIGDLSTYDLAKNFIKDKTKLPEGVLVHLQASICAGFVASIMGNPADVIKSRIMNQPTDEHGRGLLYKGPIDCFNKTIHSEGFFALYKGFIPLWFRLGPWVLLFWVSFEQIRKTLGGPAY